MNVGVFLEDFSPQVGGGYTIQGDVFHWLLELAEESPHTFVIFCRRPEELRGALRSSRVRAVAFPGNLTERVVSQANRRLTALRERRRGATRLEQVANEAGVEFMWFVGA